MPAGINKMLQVHSWAMAGETVVGVVPHQTRLVDRVVLAGIAGMAATAGFMVPLEHLVMAAVVAVVVGHFLDPQAMDQGQAVESVFTAKDQVELAGLRQLRILIPDTVESADRAELSEI